ncbi:hypothetical protein BUALT_Bualt05G0048000 [Buddleja alternifolia]|uniref:Uncharacterized protein n=1 Tax=Buddleja alternifolia TaxID=168488 RepID=A0AAV6XPQ3_9LAMI|nr:hypothetical protein BUALT_Bualt05G0048000 [Buddleja alternifolia]
MDGGAASPNTAVHGGLGQNGHHHHHRVTTVNSKGCDFQMPLHYPRIIMPPDRSWIKNRVCPGGYGVTDEYRMGVKEIKVCTPPDYMRADIWEALWDTWEDPQFKKLQENNRKNRLSDRDGNGVVKSCSGTISIAHHSHRMATKNGGNPVPKESVFNRTHKRNKGKGPFIDKKSKRTSETYTKLKEIRSQGSGNTILSPQGSSTFIPEAWAEACGGIKNRHNSYGFGKSNSGSFTFSAPAGQYPPPAPAHSQYTATGSGQYPPPTPGYYPTPPPGYFMTPATQFHIPGNYIAPGQHPPVPTQQSDQLPSPDQRHSQE